MLKVLILALALTGCASNEQIAACVQTCKGINAKMSSWSGTSDRKFGCICNRYFEINNDGTNVIEITK